MPLNTFAQQGTPYAEIVRIAEADRSDVIAMATAAPDRHRFVAEHALTRGRCPVVRCHPDQRPNLLEW